MHTIVASLLQQLVIVPVLRMLGLQQDTSSLVTMTSGEIPVCVDKGRTQS